MRRDAAGGAGGAGDAGGTGGVYGEENGEVASHDTCCGGRGDEKDRACGWYREA